ncbi:TlpA disulfide reductase family protein [Deferrisoma camini]|uniref:TlpA disulfide reductase family protein n=1 Tax=Deferrisoma camini TaxID=1035120 RepID=UPI00046D6859|nr:TlpA disulfide reductase family protein [Deferrisoma camini]
MIRSKTTVGILFVAISLFLGLDTTSAAAFKRVHGGQQAPTFTLNDLDDRPVSLDAYRDGPLTILVFWALWSPRSVPLLQEVQRLVDEFGDKGLRALTVNAEGPDAPADLESRIRAVWEENHLTLPVVLDRDLEQYNAWGVIATPATAFLAKDLKVVYEFSGHPTSAYQDMRDQVLKALGLEEEARAAAAPKRKRYQAARPVMLQYGLAKTLYHRGQLSKAKRKLRKVLKQDPAFPDAHALQGAILLALARQGKGDEAKARAEFAKAVELDETVPLGLAGLARFALADGDVAKALDLARKAVSFTEDEDLPALPPLPPPTEEGPGTEEEQRQTPPKAGERAPAATEAGREGQEAPAAAEPSEEEERAAAPAEPTEEAGALPDTGAEEPAARKGQPALPAVAYLDRAQLLLEQGDSQGAAELVGRVVDGLIGLPKKPRMKGKAMEILKKMRANQ